MVQNDKFCGWINSIPPRNNIKKINKNETCDYLIVGAGYTGLSAARKLSELHSNKKIIIVDAQLAGDGASGRNSGYLVDTTLNDGFTNNKIIPLRFVFSFFCYIQYLSSFRCSEMIFIPIQFV